MPRFSRAFRALAVELSVVASVVVGASALVACSASPSNEHASEAVDTSQDFLSVARPLSSETAAASSALRAKAVPAVGADESFYLAINKKTLGQRWFLSAFLRQYFPNQVAYGAATSLGTKVVTFRVQNGKLFVFDAADGHAASDTFDPELIIDAYPIVADTSFASRPGSDSFVLVDPAAGLNHFGFLSDSFAGPWASPAQKFSIELSFLQHYRSIADGVTFEQVFTGYSDTADPNAGKYTEGNQFHAGGTLGIALRKYTEGPGFVPGTLPTTGEFFFRNGAQLVKNKGTQTDKPIKWNIYPGMKPIQWVISDKLKTYVDTNFPGSDIVGAVQRGIESWNDVFGYKVLEAHVGTATDGPDDDVNYLYFDEDPSVGYAFANWRSNPNTGEVRGASIYFNAIWLAAYGHYFTDDPAPAPAAPASGAAAAAPALPKTAPKTPSLVWDGLSQKPLCALPAPDFRAHAVPGKHGDSSLTAQEKFQRIIQHTILHEVGHTLGLRHNFAGSLGVSPAESSTSVMDYLLDDDAIALPTPGSYDRAAIKFLYQGGAAPTAHFCTDENTTIDPDCNAFDRGANPLRDYFAPQYNDLLSYADWIGGIPANYVPYYVDPVLQYVRASGVQNSEAWSILTNGIATPLPATSTPAHMVAADVSERAIVQRLYLDKPEDRGNFQMDPPSRYPVVTTIAGELGSVLGNVDGVRSFESRRVAVDALKKMQTEAAYEALLAGRDATLAARASLTGAAAAQTDDLLARIDAAIHPYFAK